MHLQCTQYFLRLGFRPYCCLGALFWGPLVVWGPSYNQTERYSTMEPSRTTFNGSDEELPEVCISVKNGVSKEKNNFFSSIRCTFKAQTHAKGTKLMRMKNSVSTCPRSHQKWCILKKKSYKILLNFSCFLCFEDHNFFWPKFAKVKPICFAPAYILETSDTILQLLLQNSGSHINAGVKEKWQKWCIFTPKKSGSKTLLVIL